jgi:hypothetical protein
MDCCTYRCEVSGGPPTSNGVILHPVCHKSMCLHVNGYKIPERGLACALPVDQCSWSCLFLVTPAPRRSEDIAGDRV